MRSTLLFRSPRPRHFVFTQVAWPSRSRRLRPEFNACDFLAVLTQLIPPKGVQLIRRYGLYSSRTKGAWESMPHVAERAPEGCKIQHEKQTGNPESGVFGPNEDADFSDDSPDTRAYRKAWARLLSKV